MIRHVNRTLAGGLLLAFLLSGVGCQSGPKVEDVQADSDRQQRMLQQTISQLRKGLDEVREQRDEARTRAHAAAAEVSTARKELEFFEAELRALRKISATRGDDLEKIRIENGKLTVLRDESRERVRKLERELTSTRVAFEANEQLLAKLQKAEANVQGRVDNVEEKLERDRRAWEQERSALRSTLQEKDDEIAVLKERLIDGEGSGADGVVVRTGSTGRKEYYDTPPSAQRAAQSNAAQNDVGETATTSPNSGATQTPPVAITTPNDDSTNATTTSTGNATRTTTAATSPTAKKPATDDATASAEGAGFVDRATKACTTAIAQVRSVIEDPSANAKLLLEKEALTLVAVVCAVPFFFFLLWRRRRRKAKAKKAAVRVAVDGRTNTPQTIRSVATRRATPRVDETSRTGEHAPSGEPISPANVGNIAATLDAVLGGEGEGPARTNAPNPATQGPDEDELLGDLKDIVSKGLS